MRTISALFLDGLGFPFVAYALLGSIYSGTTSESSLPGDSLAFLLFELICTKAAEFTPLETY